MNNFFLAEKISKRFVSELEITKRIMEDFSFEISEEEKGTIIGIVSTFGSGKSTLLKILSGIEKYDSGTIYYNGKSFVSELSKFVFIPKNSSSLPWYNVSQNVELPYKLKKIKSDKSKIAEAISLCELDGYEDHYPHDKSKGFRLRVSLARCLTQSPEIIFLDEPFREIADETKLELQDLLVKIRLQGITIVYATSNIKDIINIADTIYLLSATPLRINKQYKLTSNSEKEKLNILTESLTNS